MDSFCSTPVLDALVGQLLVGVDPGPMDLPRKSLCLGVFVDGGGVEPDLQLITLMGWDASPNPAT